MRSLIEKIRERLRDRPDTEHEQAVVRLVIGTVFFFYLLPKALTDPDGTRQGIDQMFLSAMVVYLVTSSVIFFSIISNPRVSPLRRVLAACRT